MFSTTFLIHAQCSGVTTTWNGTSWDNGVPNINDIVIIDGEYKTKINGNFKACELAVNNGNKLIINGNNRYIKVNGNIVKNGKILIRPKASLVQVDNNATITGSGLAKVKIRTTNLQDTDRFTYLSTPTATQDASVFSGNSQIWEFGQTDQFWDYLGDGTYTGALEVSKGYAVRAGSVGAITMEFTGTFNNGIYNQPLVFNVGTHEPTVLDGNDDATLVGNPYPSGINLLGTDGLFANNVDLGKVSVWTHESSLDLGTGEYIDDDYIVCTSGGCNTNKGTTIIGGVIATGQGFFVDALANGTLTFNNAMRKTTGNNQLKNSEQDKIWLTLTSNIGYSKNVLVNFTNNGSDKFDPQFDATHSYNTTHGMTFYAINGTNDKLSIEDRGVFNETTSIPFGFIVNDNTISEFTLTIEDIQNLTNTNVYIIDHLLNTTYNLKIK